MSRETLLVGLAHPDDEVGAAGAILAQKARGDRVVVVWLTRGEMTEAFGPISTAEVAKRRTEQGRRAGEILGVETRFLDFEDTYLRPTRDAAVEVARLICDIQPTGLLTWGDAWVRGMRHPDHQAAGKIFRDAVTLGRIAKVVSPSEPWRNALPVFTYRGIHSQLPAVGLDVTPYLDTVQELGSFYHKGIGFGDPAWLESHLRAAGKRWGCDYAQEYDAWESQAGSTVDALLPAPPLPGMMHPERRR